MADSILAEAIAKRDAAAAEMQRWEAFIAMYREIAGGPPQNRVVAITGRGAVSARGHSVVASGALAETEAVAAEIIRAAGRPIPTREMLEALRNRGIDVGGKDPASTLSARLSRSRTLENVRPHGWRVKELADDENPAKDTSSANDQPQDAPVESGEEVAHEKIAHSLLD